MILSRKIISIVGKKRRSEILKRIRFVLCKVKKKKKKKEKKKERFSVYEKPNLLLETNKKGF